MTFSVGDFGYAVRAADGSRVLIPCSPSVGVDDFALPARLAGGGRTLVKASLGPHSVDDIVVPVGLVGGGQTLANLKRSQTYYCNGCESPLVDEVVVKITGLNSPYSGYDGDYLCQKVTGVDGCRWETPGFGYAPPATAPCLRLNHIAAYGRLITNVSLILSISPFVEVIWQTILFDQTDKCVIIGKTLTPLFSWTSGYSQSGTETAVVQ